MKIIPNKARQVNKSKLTASPELLKALSNLAEEGGTVSYVFLSERIRFTSQYPEGEVYHTKSILHSHINSEMFFKVVDGKKYKRNPNEIIEILEDTKWDLGASSFIIN